MLLASRGCRVLVNDYGGSIDGTGARTSAAADAVVKEIRDKGGEALANYEDVTAPSPKGGAAMVKQAMDAWGRIDIVITNAGIGVYKACWYRVACLRLDEPLTPVSNSCFCSEIPLLIFFPVEDVTVEQWKRVYDVHVFGTFNVLRAAWPHLIESTKTGGGKVVVTASAAGIMGTPNLSECESSGRLRDCSI